MAELFAKHYPLGKDYGHPWGSPRYILEMDEYEFRNLRWLMDKIYRREGVGNVPGLDTGDWCGQIRHALVDGAAWLPHKPDLTCNAGENPKPSPVLLEVDRSYEQMGRGEQAKPPEKKP